MTGVIEQGIKKRQLEPLDRKKQVHKKAKLQVDIRTALGLGLPKSSLSSGPPNPIDNDLCHLIQTSKLTSYRQRVLLALMQVPSGRFTTYAALAGFLTSSPRAVGNALRNNPFAPRVPCHRVVAADHGIGGFGGSWGMAGEHVQEKIKLLRQEGVRVSVETGKVVGVTWDNFASA